MPMYNLIEYSDNYLKTSGSLRQNYRDESSLTNNSIADFIVANNNSKSFKNKQKRACQTGANGKNNVKIMVSLKYLNNI